MLFFLIIWYSVFGNWYQNLRWIQLRMKTSIRAESGWITRSKSIESHHCCFYWKITYLLMWGGYTGWSRSYRKSVLEFCVSVLGRLRDLQYIFAVTSGSTSIFFFICRIRNIHFKSFHGHPVVLSIFYVWNLNILGPLRSSKFVEIWTARRALDNWPN